MSLPFPKPKDKEGRVKLTPYRYGLLRKRVYDEQKHNCAACGRRIWILADAELDHIKARGMGGSNRSDDRSNVRILCKPCHRKKHNQ